jgi:hypothetical protein
MEFMSSTLLMPHNYFEWKIKILLQLRGRGLYRMTMAIETKPTSMIEKSKYFNCMDEAFGLICMPISLKLLFHVESCSTPNEIWTTLEGLFGK